MPKRSDRREAERHARKLALKQHQQAHPLAAAELSPVLSKPLEVNQPKSQATELLKCQEAYLCAPATIFASFDAEPEPTAPEIKISQARLEANRANAKLSTGPVSAVGKRKSSANALKHALTGKAVLLPTDDAGEYQRLLDMRLRAFEPATEEESELVQAIVDCTWRLNRIKEIETGILLKGQLEFANKHADQPPARRLQLINTETFLKYEKSIRNLNIQEARLLRRMEKDQAKLLTMQSARKREEKQREEMQRKEDLRAKNTVHNGFEFSSVSQPSQMTKIFSQTASTQSLTCAADAVYPAIEQNSLG